MGLLMYLLIYIITVMLIIDNRIIPSRLFFLFWFTVMVCLSLSIRWTLIQGSEVSAESDLGAVVMNMRIEQGVISYHLREPVFWYGIRYLHKVIGNPGLVFVVMDVVLFLTFYKSVGLFQRFFLNHINFHNVKYLYFGAFLIYPYLAGMHNHYRQILAVTIAMYAFGITDKKLVKSLFAFLISIAIHNAMIILLPILFLAGKRKISSSLMTLIGLAIIFVAVVPLTAVFFGYDSWYEINRRLSQVGVRDTFSARNVIYLGLLIFATLFVITVEFTSKRKAHYLLIVVLIYLTVLYCFSLWAFPEQGSSRIFFIVLTLLYLLLGLYVETKFKTEPTVRLLYFHLLLVPLMGLRGDGLVYNFG